MKPLHELASRLHTHSVTFSAGDDLECVVRGLLGQSIWAIMDATGLTVGQVKYRLKKAGIQLRPFRDGDTALSQSWLRVGRAEATQQVRRTIAPKFVVVSKK